MTVELKNINVKPQSCIFTAELHIMNLPCAYVIHSATITLVDPFPGCKDILDELAMHQNSKDLTVFVRDLFSNYADSKFNDNLNTDSKKGFIIMNGDSLEYTLYHIPGFSNLPDDAKVDLEQKISSTLPHNTFIFNPTRPTDGV